MQSTDIKTLVRVVVPWRQLSGRAQTGSREVKFRHVSIGGHCDCMTDPLRRIASPLIDNCQQDDLEIRGFVEKYDGPFCKYEYFQWLAIGSRLALTKHDVVNV